ncbi:hypothetical protein ACEQ8H_004475 [Pleosporales sp. CAS-2024a]
MAELGVFQGPPFRLVTLSTHALYFVNNPSMALDAAVNTTSTLIQGVESSYPSAARHAPWILQYRLYRDTIPPTTPTNDANGKPKPFAHTLQHLLHLSSLHPSRTYICVQPPTGLGTVTAIPHRQQEPLASLLRHQFTALWQPRHFLSVQQGVTYTAGICTVQIGELRVTREGPQASGPQSPGVFVCISTIIGGDDVEESAGVLAAEDEEDMDLEYAQAIVRDCWSRIKANRDFGKSEIREVMMTSDNLKKHPKEAAVRMWCEGLRLRS